MKKDVTTVDEFIKLFDGLLEQVDNGMIIQEIIKYNDKQFALLIYDPKEIRCTFSR